MMNEVHPLRSALMVEARVEYLPPPWPRIACDHLRVRGGIAHELPRDLPFLPFALMDSESPPPLLLCHSQRVSQ